MCYDVLNCRKRNLLIICDFIDLINNANIYFIVGLKNSSFSLAEQVFQQPLRIKIAKSMLQQRYAKFN